MRAGNDGSLETESKLIIQIMSFPTLQTIRTESLKLLAMTIVETYKVKSLTSLIPSYIQFNNYTPS